MKGFVTFCACDIVEGLERCASLSSSILLLERTYVSDLLAAMSVTRIVVATYSVTEQEEEEDPIELIPESPCIEAKLFEVVSSSRAFGS